MCLINLSCAADEVRLHTWQVCMPCVATNHSVLLCVDVLCCAVQIRFYVLDEADRLLDSEDVIMKLFRRLNKGGAGLARLQVRGHGL